MRRLAPRQHKRQQHHRGDGVPADLFEPVAEIPADRVLPNFGALRLIAFIVIHAIRVIRGTRISADRSPSVVREATTWVELGNHGLISFDSACRWLDLDSGRVRAAILSRSAHRRRVAAA